MSEFIRPAHQREYTTPDDYPTRPTYVAQDHHGLESAQRLGQLLEAVGALKAEVKELRSDFTRLDKEVHGYKIGIRWTIAIGLGLGGILAWAVNAYLAYKPKQ